MSGVRIIWPATLVIAVTAVAGARPAEAALENGPALAGDTFVLGLIVLCGVLLVLMLRQSGRGRQTALELRQARRSRDTKDLLLSSDRTLALYFEADPGSLAGKATVRLTPALRRKLDLGTSGGEDTESILSVFDDRSRDVLRDRLLALRTGGKTFNEEIVTRGGRQRFTVHGERLESPEAPGGIDVVWFEAPARGAFETMVETLPLPVWRRGGDLDLEYRNPAAIALTGGEDPSRRVAARALATMQEQSESVQVVVAGDRRLFEFSERPMPDRAGTVGWAFDVTALEAIQTDLARLVAAHEEVLEELSTAIAVFGPDRRLGYFNTAFTRLWKVETDLLRDEPTVSEFLNLLRDRRRLPEQADFAAFRDPWNGMFTGLIGSRQELLFLPDETTLRMVAAAHPNGGLLLTFEDVTDRLALERSYNELSAVQRETIDNLNDALAVFGSDGRLKLLNPRFGALWHLPVTLGEDQPHVSRVLEMMQPHLADQEDWEAFRADFANRLSSRGGDAGRVERPDGLVLDYALVPLSDGATLVRHWDVTDSTLIQRALRERAEALEQADRLKSEFLANVSYELRTPLNAIIGFSELLKMQTAGPMNAKQIDYADSINASSMRLATLINDILDLASIEAGYLELELSDVDVRKLFGELVVLGRERTRWRNIVLETEVPKDITTVAADAVRLKQAMFNLVSNALQFTPNNGRITLVAARETGSVVLTVSDTGVGIPDHLQTRVLGTFERGAAAGRTTGAGLGLALVERIVRLHGGRVDLVSRVGAGTSVSCRLPDRAQAGSTREKTDAGSANLETRHG
jgi:signal transduction histidine kinase